jgi:hypothetical protein
LLSQFYSDSWNKLVDRNPENDIITSQPVAEHDPTAKQDNNDILQLFLAIVMSIAIVKLIEKFLLRSNLSTADCTLNSILNSADILVCIVFFFQSFHGNMQFLKISKEFTKKGKEDISNDIWVWDLLLIQSFIFCAIGYIESGQITSLSKFPAETGLNNVMMMFFLIFIIAMLDGILFSRIRHLIAERKYDESDYGLISRLVINTFLCVLILACFGVQAKIDSEYYRYIYGSMCSLICVGVIIEYYLNREYYFPTWAAKSNQ